MDEFGTNKIGYDLTAVANFFKLPTFKKKFIRVGFRLQTDMFFLFFAKMKAKTFFKKISKKSLISGVQASRLY